MSEYFLCKLCQDDLAINVDLKESLVESPRSKLLQKLFECYNIDVPILNKGSSICKNCYKGVSKICESLEKWSKAQDVLKARSLDIDDSKVFQINLDPNSEPELPFSEIHIEPYETKDDIIIIKEEEPEIDDIEFLEDEAPQFSEIQEESLRTDNVIVIKKEESEADDEDLGEETISEDSDDEMPTEVSDSDWRSSLQNFFCVCLGPDGLALTILFRDKTIERNIRMLCTCCNQLFATMSDIRKHASKIRPNPEYWCGACDIIYPTRFELNIHERMRKHFRARTSAMVMRCLKCGMMSKQLSDAIKHEYDVNDKISKAYHKCHDSFEKHQGKLMNQPQCRHPDKIFHLCRKCSLSFDSRDSFEKHQSKHHNHIQCRYPKCQRKFELWEQYACHLTWHKGLISRCPVPGCTVTMMPGDHVKHLRTHRKNQVIFYGGADISSPKDVSYLIITPMGNKKACT